MATGFFRRLKTTFGCVGFLRTPLFRAALKGFAGVRERTHTHTHLSCAYTSKEKTCMQDVLLNE